MEIEIELMEKEAFGEVVSEGIFETIVIWKDGDWSIVGSAHHQSRVGKQEPLMYIYKEQLQQMDVQQDSIQYLIKQIEDALNGISVKAFCD
ncbi:hypothetical protein HNQ85_002499 [Anoxybacillus calidus]|jgi:hypothetical protein|uniref:Uncharacterized protein n=1 Tax=[Anoxybacillus] calidus TaxID=575178 RepID=A0A7V9Z1G9_9BACL|nr:hypothetical protein [Anoxybacillus calidus]MBA2872190.1 hypothetical protein [Anoxybacillus calidus]